MLNSWYSLSNSSDICISSLFVIWAKGSQNCQDELMLSCVCRKFNIHIIKWLYVYYKHSEMSISYIFAWVLCSQNCYQLHYNDKQKTKCPPKKFFFIVIIFTGHPLKLLTESRWNQLGMTNPAKYPIQKNKSVSYESDMNTIWIEVAQIGRNWKPGLTSSTPLLMVWGSIGGYAQFVIWICHVYGVFCFGWLVWLLSV